MIDNSNKQRPAWFLPAVLLCIAAFFVVLSILVWNRSDRIEQNVNDQQKPTLAQQVRAQAMQLMKYKQYEPACDLMKTHVDKFRDDTLVRPLLAQAQRELGKTADAEHTVDDLLKLAPRNAKALWLKGELVRQRGGEYMPFFEHAAQDSLDATPEIWSQYGQELLIRGRHEDAQKWLEKAVSAGADDAATFGALGELKLNTQQYAPACKYLSQAIETDKTIVRLRFLLAQAQRQNGQLADAQGTIEDAISISPAGGLYMELGLILAAQEKFVESADAYVQAGSYADFRGEAAARAAELYFKQGMTAKAMQQIDIACAARPGDEKLAKLKNEIENARFGEK